MLIISFYLGNAAAATTFRAWMLSSQKASSCFWICLQILWKKLHHSFISFASSYYYSSKE